MTRFTACFACLAALVLTATPAAAGPYGDALAQCLTDATTGKERTELIRWVYVQMSRHPQLATLSRVDAEAADQADRTMANVTTRLLVQACPGPARDAIQFEGQAGMSQAFGALGRVAMQELMINPDVSAGFGAFTRFIDERKLMDVLKP